MTRLVSITTLLTFVIACSPDINIEIPELTGDWIILEKNGEPCFENEILGLRFDSSHVSPLKNDFFAYSGNYTLRNDSIFTEFLGENHIYKIIRLNQDSLTLVNQQSCQTKLYNRKLEFDPNLNFNTIYFKGIVCFGACPNMEMTLDSLGVVKFKGNRNVKFEGDTIFKISSSRLTKIDSLFKYSKINELDTNGAYVMIDDWRIKTKFDYNDTTISLNGTFSAMPFRIKPILYFLHEELRQRKLI